MDTGTGITRRGQLPPHENDLHVPELKISATPYCFEVETRGSRNYMLGEVEGGCAHQQRPRAAALNSFVEVYITLCTHQPKYMLYLEGSSTCWCHSQGLSVIVITHQIVHKLEINRTPFPSWLTRSSF